jgi:predicted nucleotide-binding protein
MEKAKNYLNVKFNSKVLSATREALKSMATTKLSDETLDVESGDALWSFDTVEEFLAAADNGHTTFRVASADRKHMLRVQHFGEDRTVAAVLVRAPDRRQIESIFSLFDSNLEACRLPAEPKHAGPKVFVGHGENPQWKELKDHLHEKHGYIVEAYEIGSRAGHTIRDILEEMLKESSFALLVMTGEDETKDGKLHARQNVVHEAGLFQGKLGFSRAVILLEDGTEEFSNINGLQQIRFSKGKIKESFGDVLAVLKRELG